MGTPQELTLMVVHDDAMDSSHTRHRHSSIANAVIDLCSRPGWCNPGPTNVNTPDREILCTEQTSFSLLPSRVPAEAPESHPSPSQTNHKQPPAEFFISLLALFPPNSDTAAAPPVSIRYVTLSLLDDRPYRIRSSSSFSHP